MAAFVAKQMVGNKLSAVKGKKMIFLHFLCQLTIFDKIIERRDKKIL